MGDPLSDFLQNGRSAFPAKYTVKPQDSPQSGGIFSFMNPMNWLRAQAQNNPQMQKVLEIIEQNGGDPKAAFYSECQKMNIDPDQAFQQIKNSDAFKNMIK